jgi:hypothetical protein
VIKHFEKRMPENGESIAEKKIGRIIYYPLGGWKTHKLLSPGRIIRTFSLEAGKPATKKRTESQNTLRKKKH